MNIIPTKIHGLLDYVVGVAMLTAPWTFDFNRTVNIDNRASNLVPIILGVVVLLYSIFTDYEWGVSRKIPMAVHLGLDFAVGAFLAASPWLFHFAGEVYLPHLVLGILAMVAAVTTSTHPGYRSQEADGRGEAATAV